MDNKETLERVKNLLLFPSYEWKVISLEKRPLREDLFQYAMRIILLGAVAQFVGSFLYIRNILDIDAYRFSFPLAQALFFILIQLATIGLTAVFIHGVSRKFQSERDLVRSFKLVIYSFTPLLCLFIIANLHPVLIIALIPGLYALYLFAKGLVPMLKTAPAKKPAFIFIFLISVAGILFVITRLFGFLSSLIFPGVMMMQM